MMSGEDEMSGHSDMPWCVSPMFPALGVKQLFKKHVTNSLKTVLNKF